MNNKVNDVASNINKELEDFKSANIKAHNIDKYIYVFYDEVAKENVSCIMFKNEDLLRRTLSFSIFSLPKEMVANAKDINIYRIGALYNNGQFQQDVALVDKLEVFVNAYKKLQEQFENKKE